jgi:DNA (cytosine-5)-methyltransferase 1
MAVPTARTVLYVEREAYACTILVKRIQEGLLDDAPVWSDLATFDGKLWRGAVDCVLAGLPCQPFSVAGTRDGEKDERFIWEAALRVLSDIRPRWFFLENVPGIAYPSFKNKASAPILRILGDLAEMGWDAEWDCFSAAEEGALHFRERFFLLARCKNPYLAAGRFSFERHASVGGIESGGIRPEKSPAYPDGNGLEEPRNVQSLDAWGRSWWQTEPGMVRVVHGSSDVVERIRVLGNSVVPVVAARAVAELHRRFRDDP